MRNTAYFFITMIAIVATLIYGQSLLQPFIFALLIWFIVRKIREILNKIKLIKNHFPNWLQSLAISLSLFFVLFFISRLLLGNINALAKSYPVYEQNVELLIAQLNEIFQINLIDYFKTHTGDFDFETS